MGGSFDVTRLMQTQPFDEERCIRGWTFWVGRMRSTDQHTSFYYQRFLCSHLVLVIAIGRYSGILNCVLPRILPQVAPSEVYHWRSFVIHPHPFPALNIGRVVSNSRGTLS